MTYEFQYLMHLLGAASTGKTAEPPKQKTDWNRVLELSDEQMLMPLICCAYKKNPSIGWPENRMQGHLKTSFSSMLTESARRSAIIGLLGKMEQEGIRTLVVKGFSIAENYDFPEARISADTDLYIAQEDEEKALEFFENQGFRVEPRWENGHHFVALHQIMGLIEVHVQLYDEIVEEVWLANVDREKLICQPHKKISTPDGEYYTLGDTDHLIFLILHMIKHFILCGMSLRMMMDVVLFMRNKKDDIDFDRVWFVMNKLRYDTFLSSVIRAMVMYCGFSVEDFPKTGSYDANKVEAILTDLEKGGWMGKNSFSERTESWQEYSRLLMLKKKNKFFYWIYIIKWQNGFGLRNFFPSKERLIKNYSCLNKYPWLLPFVWLHRLFFRGFKKAARTKEKIIFNEHDISKESQRRIDMFRLLEML